MSAARPHHRLGKSHLQRGVAAVEFALIAIFMITVLMGLLVFWRYFQAQQSLTRAAGDGSKMALTLISSGALYPCVVAQAQANQIEIQTTVKKIIQDSLKNSQLKPEQLSFLNPTWKCPDAAEGSFSFDVEYKLPTLLGTSNAWLTEPTVLKIENKIVVHFQSML